MASDAKELEKILAYLASGQNSKKALTLGEASEGASACYKNARGLLFDARLLAQNGRTPRALSLTILALEELAKIPDMDHVFLMSSTGEDKERWAQFWKRFCQHKPKQERIAAYGNVIKERGFKGIGLENGSPFMNYLNQGAHVHFDTIKQRNFYVDFVDGRFPGPVETPESVRALDTLFAFAEERADSFGSWHVTPKRSSDFFMARMRLLSKAGTEAETFEAMRRVHSINDWTASHSDEESDADVMRLLCYRSSSLIPDYASFSPECEALLSLMEEAKRVEVLKRVIRELEHRLATETLRQSCFRAFLMMKLLMSYASRHLPDEVCSALFGVSPTAAAREHFGGTSGNSSDT
jgi:AbiV family abortive infection protein